MKKIIIPLLCLTFIAVSCKKKRGSEDEKTGGCTDTDSPYYKSNLDFDDGSCKYAYVTEVEVVSFPEKDGGSKWDFDAGGGGRADIYLKIKPSNETDYTNYFVSSVENDAYHNQSHIWSTAIQFKLTNADWYYEFYDEDSGADDLIASGTFNPLSSINTSTGYCTVTNPNGTQFKLKLLIQ